MTESGTPTEPAARLDTAGREGTAGARDLRSLLKEVPVGIKALDAAASAILTFLVSHLYVPDQLQYLAKSSFGLAALAILAGWVWYSPLAGR